MTPHNPTTNCSHDVHDENGDHWVDNNGNGIHDADEGIIDPQTAYAEKLDSIISQAKHEQMTAEDDAIQLGTVGKTYLGMYKTHGEDYLARVLKMDKEAIGKRNGKG